MARKLHMRFRDKVAERQRGVFRLSVRETQYCDGTSARFASEVLSPRAEQVSYISHLLRTFW